jgi:hypothetical protein
LDTTGCERVIGTTPACGELDDLLEPVRSWPQRTMLDPVVGEGMPGSRACLPQLVRTPVRDIDPNHHEATG